MSYKIDYGDLGDPPGHVNFSMGAALSA